MLIPSSSPIIFSSDNSVEKHLKGRHEQKFHAGGGLAAAYREIAIRRKKDMDAGRVDRAMPRNRKGQVVNPDATGGYKAGIPEVIETNGLVLTPEHSLWHHMVSDGEGGYRLSDERAALHRDIIEKSTAGIPVSENPTFFMLGGGPAAGKSTALKQGVAPGVPDPNGKQAVLVNADEVKGDLPEFNRMAMSSDDADFYNAASFAHEESSMLAKRIQTAAIKNSQDVILDGTGDSSPSKLAGKINEAAESGYKVRGVYFTVPTETAWERSQARSLNSAERRFVPETVVRGTHRDVSNTFAAAAQQGLFEGGLVLIDSTTRGAAKIIGQTDANLNFVVDDQAAYDEFLAKGNE